MTPVKAANSKGWFESIWGDRNTAWRDTDNMKSVDSATKGTFDTVEGCMKSSDDVGNLQAVVCWGGVSFR